MGLRCLQVISFDLVQVAAVKITNSGTPRTQPAQLETAGGRVLPCKQAVGALAYNSSSIQ
jgi:hypothetical protein